MNWETNSFYGKYHRWNIRSKFTIPGTAVMNDLRREEESNGRVAAMDMKLAENRIISNERLKLRQEAIIVREKLQFTDRLEGLISKVSEALDEEESLLETVTKVPKILPRQSAMKILGDIEKDKVAHVQRAIEFREVHVDQVYRGETALHISARLGRPQMLLMLLNQSANHEAIDSRGNKALHYAWEIKHQANISSREADAIVIDLVTSLLQFGANPDAATQEMNSSLHIAAADGPAQSVWLLLIKGRANVEIRNKDGFTALDIARRHRQEEIVRMLTSWPRIACEMQLQDLRNDIKMVKGKTASNQQLSLIKCK